MRNAVLLTIVLVAFGFAEARACSCVPNDPRSTESVREHVEYADVVFLGKVESKETNPPESSSDGLRIETTTFYVLDSWKGEKANRIVTKINVQCCLCGASFDENENYLVFAYERGEIGSAGSRNVGHGRPLAGK